MQSDKLSRRGFVGSMFIGLTAWLCPRSSRTNAAPLRPAPSAARQPSEGVNCTSYSHDGRGWRCTTYTYDGIGRLVSTREHQSSASFTYEPGNT
jgi:YD repeat-containing protein